MASFGRFLGTLGCLVTLVSAVIAGSAIGAVLRHVTQRVAVPAGDELLLPRTVCRLVSLIATGFTFDDKCSLLGALLDNMAGFSVPNTLALGTLVGKMIIHLIAHPACSLAFVAVMALPPA
jgi:fructose-specific phosphotransferase system IIC component